MEINITKSIIKQINVVLAESEKLNEILHDQDQSLSIGVYTHPKYDEFDYVSIHKGRESIQLCKDGGELPTFGGDSDD